MHLWSTNAEQFEGLDILPLPFVGDEADGAKDDDVMEKVDDVGAKDGDVMEAIDELGAKHNDVMEKARRTGRQRGCWMPPLLSDEQPSGSAAWGLLLKTQRLFERVCFNMIAELDGPARRET